MDIFQAAQFTSQARRELDWEHSHAHWLVEEYMEYVLDGTMTLQEALSEWRKFLNDDVFGTLTPDQVKSSER